MSSGSARPLVPLYAASAVLTLGEGSFGLLLPPSWEALVERLTGRGTEDPEIMRRRLETAREELAARSEFDATVVNADLRSATDELVRLVVGPRS